MVQEQVDSDGDPFEDFCGMYNPHEENNNDDDASNHFNASNHDSIDDDAAQHVQHIKAEVHHCSQLIACHREADRHVYDRVVEDEREQIALLPQTMHIMQQQWQQLYDAEEHKHLQQAITDELNMATAMNDSRNE